MCVSHALRVFEVAMFHIGLFLADICYPNILYLNINIIIITGANQCRYLVVCNYRFMTNLYWDFPHDVISLQPAILLAASHR